MRETALMEKSIKKNSQNVQMPNQRLQSIIRKENIQDSIYLSPANSNHHIRSSFTATGWIEEKPGVFRHLSGDYFVGSWLNSQFHGEGAYHFANGEKFQGQFQKGSMITGKYFYNNGSFYQGSFKNGHKNGYGTMKYSNGSLYSGFWINGDKQGQGILSDARGSWEGCFVDGIPRGLGRLEYSDEGGKILFEGHFLNGLMVEGNATIFYQDGSQYQGRISNNTFNGHGIFTSLPDASFTGTFQDGYPSYGTQIIENEIYHGAISPEGFTGEGEYKYVNGDIYKGTWTANLKHGRGIYIFSNGDIYEGQFHYDIKEGHGKYLYATGESFEGFFRNNQREGKGIYQAQGFKYQGEFVAGLMHGTGILNGRNVLMHSNLLIKFLDG